MKLYSKAGTLNFLSKDKNFKIPKLKSYKVKFYINNKDKVLNYIKKNFSSKIALRSSNVYEDKNSTKAGMFKSYLNINPKNYKDVKRKIEKVINSYKNYQSSNNEFFVQEMVKKPIYSGVCFTKNIQDNTPEWKINYTKSKDTTLVTSGRSEVRSINFLEKKQIKFKNKVFKKFYF